MAGRRARRILAQSSRPGCLLAMGVLLSPLVAGPAAAQLPAATISPGTGPTGTTVTVAGGDCRKRGPEAAEAHVVAETLGVDLSVATAADGTWTADFVVTEGASPGPHVVSVSCVRKPSADFYPPLTFTVSPAGAGPTTAPPSAPTTVTTASPTRPSTTVAATPASPTSAPGGDRTPPPSSSEVPPGAPVDTASSPTAAGPDPASNTPSGSRRSDSARTGEDGATTSSSSSPALAVAGSSIAVIAGAVLLRRRARRARKRDTGLGVSNRPVETLAALNPTVSAEDEPEADAPDGPAPTTAVTPRPEHQVTDVVRTMAVLEPVLRASARPDVIFVLDATTDEVKAPLGPHELEAVVVPLVDHAAGSLAHGGTIRVVVGRGPCPAAPDADWALVVVADTGPGTTTEADPSSRPNLDSVRDAVAALGGHLDVTSVARHGTTATVALPLVEEPDPSDAVGLDSAEVEASGAVTAG